MTSSLRSLFLNCIESPQNYRIKFVKVWFVESERLIMFLIRLFFTVMWSNATMQRYVKNIINECGFSKLLFFACETGVICSVACKLWNWLISHKTSVDMFICSYTAICLLFFKRKIPLYYNAGAIFVCVAIISNDYVETWQVRNKRLPS